MISLIILPRPYFVNNFMVILFIALNCYALNCKSQKTVSIPFATHAQETKSGNTVFCLSYLPLWNYPAEGLNQKKDKGPAF